MTCDISIIMPVLNERALIGQALSRLALLDGRAEVIVVDGGSSDGTLQVAQAAVRDAQRGSGGATNPLRGGTSSSVSASSAEGAGAAKLATDPAFSFLSAPVGRGIQMNAGARAAQAPVLLFLHADSQLPAHALDQIGEVMRSFQAGCFGIAFDRGNAALRICAAWSNARARRGIMFGDQGIFITRDLFERVGGFHAIPLMEDYQLSLDLRAENVACGMTRERIVTSARRLGTTAPSAARALARMVWLRRRYRQGADPCELARQYREVR